MYLPWVRLFERVQVQQSRNQTARSMQYHDAVSDTQSLRTPSSLAGDSRITKLPSPNVVYHLLGHLTPPERDFHHTTKMPPKHDSEQETRIIQAIEAIHSEESLSICAASRIYDVPRSTLADRLHGLLTRQSSQIAARKLLSTKEEALL